MVSGLTSDTNDIWKYLLQNNQQGWQQAFPNGEVDISQLPESLRSKIEGKADFKEGDPDRIDTDNEVRKFAELLGTELKNMPGAPPGFDPQLLIDWIMNKQHEQNRPAGGGGQSRGTMNGQQFANTQPASFNGSSTGGGGGGTSGGGGTTSAGGGGSVSPTGKPTDTSGIKGNTNAEKALNYFIGKGLTPEQAAGIVGNLQAESGVKPDQHQIGGPAFGIAQWEGGRQDNLRAFAQQQGKDVNDSGVQLDFLWGELQGPENASFKSLQGATSAGQAAAIFENEFERPAANHNAERAALAEAVLAEFGRGNGNMNA